MTSKGQKVYAVVKTRFKVFMECKNPIPQPYFEPFGDMVEICLIMANKEDAVRAAERLTEHDLFHQYEVREFELG